MKKTPSLFKRDYGGRRELLREVVPGSEWVLRGEGTPTRKYNCTCCLVEGGELYRRYDAKLGRTPPAGFRPAQPDPDPVTEHWPGWLPVMEADGAARYHRAAWGSTATRFSTRPKPTFRPSKKGTWPRTGRRALTPSPRAARSS